MLFNGCAQENFEKKIYRIIRDASEVRDNIRIRTGFLNCGAWSQNERQDPGAECRLPGRHPTNTRCTWRFLIKIRFFFLCIHFTFSGALYAYTHTHGYRHFIVGSTIDAIVFDSRKRKTIYNYNIPS